jgi:hypothetical protein
MQTSRHACIDEPAAHDLHARTWTEPDEISFDPRLTEEVGDARHSIGGQPLLGSAQVDPVEVRRGIGALLGQRDGDVGRAERRGVEPMLFQPVRTAPSIHMHVQPLHQSGELKLVHEHSSPLPPVVFSA